MTGNSPPLRVALIGLNKQGAEHARALHGMAGFEITAACDKFEDALQKAREGEPPLLPDSARTFTDIEALFAAGGFDAAVVALPHDQHGLAVALAAKHGVHLLKEKPLGRTLQEAHRFAATMRQAGLVLHTGVQRRQHETYRRLVEHVERHQRRGRFRAASIRITLNFAPPAAGTARSLTWRDNFELSGGGVLIDLGYHGVDLAQLLLGPLNLVACTLSSFDAPNAARTVETAASVWATAGATWVHLHFDRHGERKIEEVILEHDDGLYIADRSRAEFHPRGGAPELICSAAPDWLPTQRAQLEAFGAAVRERALATNDLATQLPALRFLEACYARHANEGLFGLDEVRS